MTAQHKTQKKHRHKNEYTTNATDRVLDHSSGHMHQTMQFKSAVSIPADGPHHYVAKCHNANANENVASMHHTMAATKNPSQAPENQHRIDRIGCVSVNSHKARRAELKVDRQTVPDTLKRIIAILLKLLTGLAQNIRKCLS